MVVAAIAAGAAWPARATAVHLAPATAPAALASVQDSIRHLLYAGYLTAASALASRHVAETERRFGRDSREGVDALLLEAEAQIGRAPQRECIELLDRIERNWASVQGSERQLATIERLRGKAFYLADDLDSALVHAERSAAILLAAGAGETSDYGRTLILRARTLRGAERGAEALPLIEQARGIFERTGGSDNVLLYQALELLAWSPKYAGDPAGALELFDRVLAGMIRHFGARSPSLMLTYYRLSAVYEGLGRLDKSRQACLDGIAVADANPKDCDAGLLHYALGNLAITEKNYALADSIYSGMISSTLRGHPKESLALVYPRHARAVARYFMGHVREAEEELIAIAPLVRKYFGDSSGFSVQNDYWRGLCAMARGDTATASGLLAQSANRSRIVRAAGRPAGSSPETDYSDASLALCHWLSGRPSEAFDLALRVESDSHESLRRTARTLSDVDALALEKQGAQGLGLALTALVDGLPGRDAEARAFDAVVRSRAVVLDAITGRHRAARASRDPATIALADSLEALERRITAQATRKPTDAESAEGAAIDARRRSITARLASFDPALARAYEGEAIGAEQVRAALSPRQWLVSFVRFEHHDEAPGSAIDDRRTTPWYVAFVTTSGVTPRVVNIGSAEDIDAQIDRWRALVASAERGAAAEAQMRALGDSLRTRLWDPIAPADGSSDVSADRILVVPDGAIALLPMLALPDRNGAALLEWSPPLVYLSAERDLVAGSYASRSGTGLLVLGDPDFTSAKCGNPDAMFALASSGDLDERPVFAEPKFASFRGKTSDCEEFHELRFSRLAETGAEGRDVARLSEEGREPCALLLREEASEESFKRYAPGRRLIHIASHGFALSGRCQAERGTGESPLVRAGIALAGANARAEGSDEQEDGILTAEEVAVLDMTGTECVVLSACESGVGELVTGEGVLGMRRAFHMSGAATLVSTLWKVDDAAARMWVREFYRGLFGKHPEPADAAHHASLAVLRRLRRAGGEPSPATWGAFVVCGVSDR